MNSNQCNLIPCPKNSNWNPATQKCSPYYCSPGFIWDFQKNKCVLRDNSMNPMANVGNSYNGKTKLQILTQKTNKL